MKVVFACLLFVLGACFGSFLCCQARRLKLSQESRGTRRARCDSWFSFNSRSICLHCKTKLKWYDNIPIISWLMLKGKCRKCHHKIGYAEILSEFALGIAWLALSLIFNFFTANILDWCIFIATLVLSLPLMFLAIYDALYGELPTLILILAIILSTVLLAMKEWQWVALNGFSTQIIFDPLCAALILGGLYLFLYLISRGAWVGDGDWLLGLSLGLSLGSAWSALIALFVANFSATLIMLPAIKKTKNHQISFGPFLVFGFIVALIMV